MSTTQIKDLTVGSQKIGEEQTEVEKSCSLDSRLDKYKIYFYEYINYDGSHDILKFKCTSIKRVTTLVDAQYADMLSVHNGTVESKENISYIYFQKGLGMIATIDDDCIVSKSPDIVDDTVEKEECFGEQYHYILYHPEY